jgi:hypothetical protein
MVKKNMNEGKKGAEKNQRKNIRTQQDFIRLLKVDLTLQQFQINMLIRFQLFPINRVHYSKQKIA